MDGWAGWAAPVGPWRAVELASRGSGPALVASNIETSCDGSGGSVRVQVALDGIAALPAAARVRVAPRPRCSS
jgi:hypothetical protein